MYGTRSLDAMYIAASGRASLHRVNQSRHGFAFRHILQRVANWVVTASARFSLLKYLRRRESGAVGEEKKSACAAYTDANTSSAAASIIMHAGGTEDIAAGDVWLEFVS